MEIGSRIRMLRENAGLSQIELAKVLKIGNSTLSQYESGARVPSDDIKISIVNYFDVSLDYLLGRTDEKEKAPTQESERTVGDKEIMFALWGDTADVDEGDLEDVKRYAAFVRERKKKA